jgi:hypothetical protein
LNCSYFFDCPNYADESGVDAGLRDIPGNA